MNLSVKTVIKTAARLINGFKSRARDYKIISAVTISLTALLIIGAVFVFKPIRTDGKVEFKIDKNQTLNEIADSLKKQNLIRSRSIFALHSFLTGNEKKFKAGIYIIEGKISTNDLVIKFSRGFSKANDIVVTIPEGTNISGIDFVLSSAGLIEEGELLKPEFMELEGYLFPDSYRFHDCTEEESRKDSSIKISIISDVCPVTLEQIVEKMRDNFEQKTAELLKDLSDEDKKEIIIIASMLEKEVRLFEDMRIVSGIMRERTKIGMKLEIDATVAYGVCHKQFLEGKPCRTSWVNLVDNIPVDSEYNTYKRHGLPVGPISNPGLDSIRAALDPAETMYLFYLNTRDTGQTIFSRDGKEHTEARRKYLGL